MQTCQTSQLESFEFHAEASLAFDAGFGLKRDESGESYSDPSYYLPQDASIPESLKPLLPALPKSSVITLSNIPPYLDHESILRFVKEETGFDAQLELTAPNPEKNFYRLGWLRVEGVEASSLMPKLEAKGSIDGSKVYFGLSSTQVLRFKLASVSESDEVALKAALDLISLLDDSSVEQVSSKLSTLDAAVVYLRTVHNFCFYCGQGFSCAAELESKCGDLHLRQAGGDRNYAERVSAVTEFIRRLKEASSEAGEVTDEALDKHLTANEVIKVEEEKYRCAQCSKAFKGPEFVVKHLRLKHEDIVAKNTEDLAAFNVFLSKASMALFPSNMIPRFLSLKPRTIHSRDSSKSSLSRRSSTQQENYKDWDALQVTSTEISYDFTDE